MQLILLLHLFSLQGTSTQCDSNCMLPHNPNVTLCWGPGHDMCQQGEFLLNNINGIFQIYYDSGKIFSECS